MANARIIRQNFFDNPRISNYEVKERYFLIGLACAADDFGRFWYNESSLKSNIFPTDDKITKKWIKYCVEMFIKDLILCQYEVEGINYAHFPKWFKNGWFLKQRIDHPKEFLSPDCPLCMTEEKTRNKREISRAIKDNKIKINKTKINTIKEKLTKEEIRDQLVEISFTNDMLKKYPRINKNEYSVILKDYLTSILNHDTYDQDHKRQFQRRLLRKDSIIAENANKD